MKKTTLPFVLSIAAFALVSCSDDAPAKKSEFRPVRLEEVAYKRELIYNSAGQVAKVASESQMPDNDVIATVQEF